MTAPKDPVRGRRPAHEPAAIPDDAPAPRARFVTTTVEIEGREETRVVEIPAFEPDPWGADTELAVVGQRVVRVDSADKVTGRARYTTDIQRPRMAFAAFVRARIARGKVTRVDAEAALAIPGVLAVVTTVEVRESLGGPAARLFDPGISYAGQPVAVACGTTEEAARRGAAAVRLEYEALPHAVSFATATAAGAPEVRPKGNLSPASPIVAERGDVARGLREADVTVTREFRTPVALHSALEPHGCVAEWEGDRLTVWESTQGIFRVRAGLARAFGLPLVNVRVIKEHMGGGFGAKSSAGQHSYAAALLARRLGRPVRCIVDREGEQTDTGNRPATVQRVTLGARSDGRLTAILLDADIPLGLSGWEGGPGKIYHELYSCPNVRTSETCAYVNAPAMSAFRAPGHAEGAFGLERAMDELARALGMDPLALRELNFAERDEEKDRPWSVNRLRDCYAEAARRFGWPRSGRVPGNSGIGANLKAGGAPAPDLRHGVGVAAQCWGAGGGPPAYALVRINPDGSADILTGTQDLGTGARTILTQVGAESLGIPMPRVRCIIGDTERTPYTGPSWGSTTTPSVAPAVRLAAEDARGQLLEAAAQFLEVEPDTLTVRDGIVHSQDGREISVADVCLRLGDVMIIGRGARGPNPERTAIHTFGVQMAEVEVDVGTGVVRVTRLVAVHDGGRVINPTLAGSQLEGGIIQGIGYALFEERVMDQQTGLGLNPTLHDYKVPTMADIPDIDAHLLDGADIVANHTGARGIAEAPIIPTAPAIANAVRDAIGVEVNEIPLAPWRVLAALESASG